MAPNGSVDTANWFFSKVECGHLEILYYVSLVMNPQVLALAITGALSHPPSAT